MVGERVLRHQLADRLYHWTMAAALLVCLFTAFLPILGWKFEWVTARWIAGIVLTAAVLFHMVRAVVWQDFWWIVRARAMCAVAGAQWHVRLGAAGRRRSAVRNTRRCRALPLAGRGRGAGHRGDEAVDVSQDRRRSGGATPIGFVAMHMGNRRCNPQDCARWR